tara:strand:- start:3183 stop:3728 length:546 start_codon:yes stop_codon:yes gene_type:complete
MKLFRFFNKKENKIRSPRMRRLAGYGEIDISNLKGDYECSIMVENHSVHLDVNFEKERISEQELLEVTNFIENVEKHHLKNLRYIQENFDQGASMSSEYIQFYIEELEPDELDSLVNTKSQVKTENQLLEKLTLKRIGVYPEASYYANFDYTIYIHGEPCNQLLVVNSNQDGTLHDITWES